MIVVLLPLSQTVRGMVWSHQLSRFKDISLLKLTKKKSVELCGQNNA